MDEKLRMEMKEINWAVVGYALQHLARETSIDGEVVKSAEYTRDKLDKFLMKIWNEKPKT